MSNLQIRMANAIRALSMDAVQQANSGHPGMPMGMADIAVALWNDHLQHNPTDPHWMNRDRFVLSNGHGSMLLYSLLHLTGYDLPISELKNFRQLHSKTAGHPEYGITPGVETTTGPLGQGISNAVGMALAEKLLAEEFNRPGHDIVNHYTYVFLGDGCLMEGISHEVCSLAGTLKLNKLIALWDDNGISIDGKVVSWFNEDTPKRFEAYGWNVIRNVDGHDAEAVSAAIAQAKKTDKPTLICCKTAIGQGAPNMAGSDKVHGSPLGPDEIAATRVALNWPYAPFEIPQDIYQAWDFKRRGQALEHEWNKDFQSYKAKYPELASEFQRRMQGDLSKDFSKTVKEYLERCQVKAETIATRKASQNAIEALALALPEFMGGSADLTGSNLTNWSACKPVRANQWGNHINYGVREFGMSAIMNGIALHGGYIPFGGTFLTFSDYSRNAIRMAALMKLRSIFVFTHDSIGLGEDGPTHQSVEHVASLRLIPNLMVWRPCDTSETAVAWASAVERKHGPSALIFSRQNCPFVARNAQQIKDIARGGYVIRDSKARPDAVIMATGSEVGLALQTAERLEKEGVAIRVVSIPSTTVFDQQDATYKASVLPAGIPRIAVEAGVSDFWWKYACSAVHGVDTFGESAPAAQLYEYFGLTVDQIAKTVRQVISQQ
ncbi:transketolase [Polynucleobacter paneuropaeus]|uniref:transketolase n=1 Tax=Polynucleobacter paneuropaeus TaxID=2527775 RepID=UPI001C330CA3|nr:transketolase [Polynucleobacter paneuropaeus]MBT8517244.1 transketolase [Polynucleobacter paneuropaeus]MBT8520089.1 transketolase [Polynucleobacter paneuropaeus]MBT8544460.1 transketolase [Polynucleobacter paneuropaeus]MBT8547856.1 transketolase [Polynucleobacter paneuropaeus]MBT8555480.1 transketolase [Polynucleobacter paneuropaeus]